MNHYHRISLLLLESAALLSAPVIFAFPLPQNAKSPCTVNLNLKKPNSELLSKESRLGRQLAKEVERASKIVDDLATTQYLNRLAQNLVRNSDAPFPITVKIIDSAAKNELILPGGFLYIDDGLILQAETESELVGALAYGVAYTALRCGTEQATLGQFMRVSSIPAMIFEPNGWAGYDLYEGMNLAIPLTYLREQREFVLAADRLGLKYLYETGYDPIESARLLGRISPQNAPAKNAQNAFSPFPPLTLRLDCMRKEIAKVFPSRDEAIISSSEFEKTKERLSSRKLTDSQPVLRPILRNLTDP
jgi:beta-barrel assembly-enhancing protease